MQDNRNKINKEHIQKKEIKSKFYSYKINLINNANLKCLWVFSHQKEKNVGYVEEKYLKKECF